MAEIEPGRAGERILDKLPEDKHAQVAACLDKILKSQTFTSSGRLTSFLSYVVLETLEGRGDKLKGYTIALSVFGFNDRFDPQTNSIVRVEATRLRKKLTEYYEGPGADDPIEIRINRGTYVPEFIERRGAGSRFAAAAAEEVAPDETKSITAAAHEPRQPRHFQAAALAAAALLLGGGIGLYLWRTGETPKPSATQPVSPQTAQNVPLPAGSAFALPPVLTVTQIVANPRANIAAPDAMALSRELATAIGRFDNITVLDRTAGANGSAAAEYRLAGEIGRNGDQLEASFRLLYGPQNEVVWSRRYPIASPAFDLKARAAIVAGVASTLARTSGVIVSDRFRRMPALEETTVGFPCIVHCAKYYETPSEPLFAASRNCLKRTLAAEPKNAGAHAALALLTVDGHLRNYVSAEAGQGLANAAALAHDALALAPQSAQAHLALFMARFFDRRFEDAFASARQALAANPHSVEIRSRIGAAQIMRGEFDKGLAMLRDVTAIVEHGPAWLDTYYFLPAYMSGDMDTARRYATRVRSARSPFGVLTRIVMAQQDKDGVAAAKWTAQLREKFPRFAEDIPGALQRLALADPIRDKLLADLKDAGAVQR